MTTSTARATDHRLPDFFIVGQGKSGTTALYEMLRKHPQIYMPAVKEPSFFSGDLQPRPHPSLITSFADYIDLFREAEPTQLAGEASPTYIWSREAAKRIAEVQPNAKVIAIFREPASFVASLHLELVKQGFETAIDLRKALALEDSRRRGKKVPKSTLRPTALLYSDRVKYTEQLARFHDVFPADQVLVLIYDDFRADNQATLRTILTFLRVDDSIPLVPRQVNVSVRVRSARAQNALRALSMGEGAAAGTVKKAIKTVVPANVRRKGVAAAQRRLVAPELKPADEELMAELRRRFKPEVVSLSRYVGRDLVTLWGYDQV